MIMKLICSIVYMLYIDLFLSYSLSMSSQLMRITAAAPDLKVPGDVTPPPPSLLHRLEGHCQISTGISRIGTIITTHTETKVRAITQAGELGILTIVNMVNFDVLTCTFYSKGIQSINFLHINPLQGCKKIYVLDLFFGLNLVFSEN